MPDFVKKYFDGHENDPYARSLSFDICHDYFNAHRGVAAADCNLRESILVLWGYLGSWGMLRGSAKLSKTNPYVLKDVIAVIDEYDYLFDVDIPLYEKYAANMEECYDKLSKALSDHNPSPTLTLVTKIMFGVYSCIPAIDTNVWNYIKAQTGTSPSSIDSAIHAITAVYANQRQHLTPCLVTTAHWTGGTYRRICNSARLFDMLAYVEGLKTSRKKKA